MITCQELSPGLQECELNLAVLYSSEDERIQFEQKWVDFLPSDPDNVKVFSRTNNDTLTYLTESFIPSLKDDRPPLLLLLGNPASHSVASGMCFAFEGDGREHRFWRVMRETEILDFNKDSDTNNQSGLVPIEEKKNRLLSLQYSSPFRISIDVFFSIPSAASHKKWSGVAGLRKLFGSKALKEIARLSEKSRPYVES